MRIEANHISSMNFVTSIIKRHLWTKNMFKLIVNNEMGHDNNEMGHADGQECPIFWDILTHISGSINGTFFLL